MSFLVENSERSTVHVYMLARSFRYF